MADDSALIEKWAKFRWRFLSRVPWEQASDNERRWVRDECAADLRSIRARHAARKEATDG
jgi:hypothetical protein